MKRLLRALLSKNYFLYFMGCKLRQAMTALGEAKINNRGCARIVKSVIGRENTITINKGAVCKTIHIYIRGSQNCIVIEEGCILGKNCSIRIEGNNCRVQVGKRTTMTRDIHLCAQENNMGIVIGEDCMFSNNIIVRTSDSHPIYDKDGIRINEPQQVIIGSHVWIAPETTILKGVKIGDNSIIGSKSLVTKDVESGCLYGGVPSRLIKRGVQWTREELY